MSKKIASIGVAAAIAVAVGTVAMGQSTPNGQEVNIEASKVVTIREGHARTGIHNETVQLSRQVRYGDLDLGAKSGEAELHRRISDTAASVCKELGLIHPAGSVRNEWRDQKDCVTRAVDDAMTQMKPVIAAAQEGQHE